MHLSSMDEKAVELGGSTKKKMRVECLVFSKDRLITSTPIILSFAHEI